MIKKYLLLSLLFILPLVVFVFPVFAQRNDAIAIQIRSNPDRYSALRWYEEVEKFEGAPQVLLVDGYEAIRDGRTVYVNAGNLTDSGSYYSNIYLISYSQNPGVGTADVFANMLKHWLFNSNLVKPNDFGNCNISTMECVSNADCKAGYECRNAVWPAGDSGKAHDNKCHLPITKEEELTCWRDRDCPKNIFCDSEKAKITRRTLRYANLVDVRTKIMEYKETEGIYPKLLAGSYIPGITLSTWPSWNQTLANDVFGGEFPLDPLNIMGACSSEYNPTTCWNETERLFSEGNTPANRMISGPAGSSFYGYFPGIDTAVGAVYSYSEDGIFACPLDGSSCKSL